MREEGDGSGYSWGRVWIGAGCMGGGGVWMGGMDGFYGYKPVSVANESERTEWRCIEAKHADVFQKEGTRKAKQLCTHTSNRARPSGPYPLSFFFAPSRFCLCITTIRSYFSLSLFPSFSLSLPLYLCVSLWCDAIH